MKKRIFIFAGIIAVVVVVALGCDCEENQKAKQFKLQSGDIVTCKYARASECGAFLKNCTNGKEYSCQTNVEEQQDKPSH